jgi:hypothetical protein
MVPANVQWSDRIVGQERLWRVTISTDLLFLYSQRASDREFNSQNYPGHAYYGLRVALSEAGWRRISAAKAK